MKKRISLMKTAFVAISLIAVNMACQNPSRTEDNNMPNITHDNDKTLRCLGDGAEIWSSWNEWEPYNEVLFQERDDDGQFVDKGWATLFMGNNVNNPTSEWVPAYYKFPSGEMVCMYESKYQRCNSYCGDYGALLEVGTSPEYLTTAKRITNICRDIHGNGNNPTVVNPSEYTFTDTRGDTPQTYRIVDMPDGKTWFAENLNYDPGKGNSFCYGRDPDSCAKYGRLYSWTTAMDIIDVGNSTLWNGNGENHQGVCPTGWHIPSYAEWSALVTAIENDKGVNTAAEHLKAQGGWYNCGPSVCTKGYWYQCNDTYSFSALPAGYWNDYEGGFHGAGIAGGSNWYGSFNSAGHNGYWWSATEDDSEMERTAWHLYISSGGGSTSLYPYYKYMAYSVRCVRD